MLFLYKRSQTRTNKRQNKVKNYGFTPFISNCQKLDLYIKSRLHSENRALNNQPIQLHVEVLVITDSSVYKKHQTYAGTTDMNMTFAHMRLYYAHLINGVFILISIKINLCHF